MLEFMEMAIRLLMEYDGTRYVGWQIQPNGNTIQAELEKAVHHLTGHYARVYGASRTDSGVHARGQVAVVNVNTTIPPEKFAQAINSRLPKDIVILHSDIAPDGFDPRRSAKQKLYIYRIQIGSVRNALMRHIYWHVKLPLSVKAMQDAAKHFEGTHDFTSFCNHELAYENNIRTIDRCEVIIEEERFGTISLRVEVEGRSFLYNQVRNMVGTLVDIGSGRFTPEIIPYLFDKRNRNKAGQGAPALGLCLEWIRY